MSLTVGNTWPSIEVPGSGAFKLIMPYIAYA